MVRSLGLGTHVASIVSVVIEFVSHSGAEAQSTAALMGAEPV